MGVPLPHGTSKLTRQTEVRHRGNTPRGPGNGLLACGEIEDQSIYPWIVDTRTLESPIRWSFHGEGVRGATRVSWAARKSEGLSTAKLNRSTVDRASGWYVVCCFFGLAMKALLSSFLFLLFGSCGTSAESTTLPCAQTLDAFCTTNPTACDDRGYASALAVACAGSPNGTTHGFGDCGDYHVLSEQAGNGPWTNRYFGVSSGTLVAITVETPASTSGSSSVARVCLAGPATFQPPTCSGVTGTPCSNPVSYDSGMP
jgi:hypothetical protein